MHAHSLITDQHQTLNSRELTPDHTKKCIDPRQNLPILPPTHTSTYLRNPRNLADSRVSNIIALIISLNIVFFLFHTKEHVFSKKPKMY